MLINFDIISINTSVSEDWNTYIKGRVVRLTMNKSIVHFYMNNG